MILYLITITKSIRLFEKRSQKAKIKMERSKMRCQRKNGALE
jgi:hypothetical protein